MTGNGQVIDCLGRLRAVETFYPDGSFNCPFCGYARPGDNPNCPNPACFARGDFPPERARELLAAEDRRKAEIVERERQHAARMAEIKADETRRAERSTEIARQATARGACVRCALESARYMRTPKFTKHRGICPRERK